jgi:hypothetical protein
MTSSKPPRTRTGAADDPGLQALLALPPGERRDAVAKDVRRRAPQFSAIHAHDLADALDVPEHWRPGSEWSFTRYASIVSVEEHARYNSPASELVYLIEEAVTAERFQQLLKHSEPLDESEDPSFAFLTKAERSRLEDVIAEKQMEANESNGMNCIASCSVESDSGAVLDFEGDVEETGPASICARPTTSAPSDSSQSDLSLKTRSRDLSVSIDGCRRAFEPHLSRSIEVY